MNAIVDTLSLMQGPQSESVRVTDIEVDRTAAVTVVFDDGFGARFELLQLRRMCPCAGCHGAREQGRAVYSGESISVLDAELHGNWAISIQWSDGHNTGMFAWTYLRALAEAARNDADSPEPETTETSSSTSHSGDLGHDGDR